MAFYHKYPYTDFHELNLDWFLAEFKKVMDATESLDQTVEQFTQFVTNYFDNLDVQAEVNVKLDQLVADGTIANMLQPLLDDYIAHIDEVVDDQNAVIGGYRTEIDTLVARMDTFASLPPGATSGNAELLDIRNTYDGITDISAGDAVRNQVSFLHYLTDDVIVPEKNLFDVSGVYTPIDPNCYYAYNTGTRYSNASYNSTFMKCEPGKTYTTNSPNMHITFWADINHTTYISGVVTGNASLPYHNFTAPAGAYHMILSPGVNNTATMMVVAGSVGVPFQPFKLVVPSSKVSGSARQILFVGPADDYTTIQAAIDAAASGDVIYIRPGTYAEEIDNNSGKFLHIIGSGKGATVVEVVGDGYGHPALKADVGYYEGITFRTTATTPGPGETICAYAAHIDYNTEANSSLDFVNCEFITASQPAVGIGLRENYTLTFRGCYFEAGYASAFYCHEQQASNKVNQKVELIDCAINTISASNPGMLLQETRSYTGTEATILAQRVIVKKGSAAQPVIAMKEYPDNATPGGTHYLNSYGWYLDKMSDLNNEFVLNA